jgi:hypothetical protein
MSHYVYITRKPDPTADDGSEISEQDWRELALAQSDLRSPTSEELATSSLPGSVQASDFALSVDEAGMAWLAWHEGQVEVRNPDTSTIARLLRLAPQLGARVVSETGETFDATGAHAGFEAWSEFHEAPKRPSLFKRLFGGAGGT